MLTVIVLDPHSSTQIQYKQQQQQQMIFAHILDVHHMLYLTKFFVNITHT